MELLSIVVTSALLIPLAIFTSGLARIVLGLLFIFFFPGYTLMAALFPRKTDLDGITRLALSLGISIALVVIILLLLNLTPWGLRLYPTLISLLLFTDGMAVIAWFRRHRLNPGERFAPALSLNPSRFFRSWINQSQRDKILSALLTVAVIGVIGTLGYVITRPMVGEKFTEFYILDLQKKAEYYPQQLVTGEEGKVILGIVNRECEATVYKVEIALNGKKVNEIGPINLESEEKWEQLVAFAPTKVGPDQKIEFRLYKQSREPYRVLHLWIDVKERS